MDGLKCLNLSDLGHSIGEFHFDGRFDNDRRHDLDFFRLFFVAAGKQDQTAERRRKNRIDFHDDYPLFEGKCISTFCPIRTIYTLKHKKSRMESPSGLFFVVTSR